MNIRRSQKLFVLLAVLGVSTCEGQDSISDEFVLDGKAVLSKEEERNATEWFGNIVKGVAEAKTAIRQEKLTARLAQERKSQWTEEMELQDKRWPARYRLTSSEGQLFARLSTETGAVASIYDQWIRGNRQIALEECDGVMNTQLLRILPFFPNKIACKLYLLYFSDRINLSSETGRAWDTQQQMFKSARLTQIRLSQIQILPDQSDSAVTVKVADLSSADADYVRGLVRQAVAKLDD